MTTHSPLVLILLPVTHGARIEHVRLEDGTTAPGAWLGADGRWRLEDPTSTVLDPATLTGFTVTQDDIKTLYARTGPYQWASIITRTPEETP